MQYQLDHLTQEPSQEVLGPIQDDEALFLYALIRCMLLRRVLEVGGGTGYSARNFCRAVGPRGLVVTVNDAPLEPVATNHVVLVGVGANTISESFGPLDLVFFDCHNFDFQMQFLRNLQAVGGVTEATLLALHDTNLHPAKVVSWSCRQVDGGFVHQPAERRMVNWLRDEGYEALNVHTVRDRHDASLPYRHGLTILSKNRMLPV